MVSGSSFHSDKQQILLGFFKNLVGSSTPTSFSFDLDNLLLQSSLSPSQARDIVRLFSAEEIKGQFF